MDRHEDIHYERTRLKQKGNTEDRDRSLSDKGPSFGNRTAVQLMEGVIQRAVPVPETAGFPKPVAVVAGNYSPQGDDVVFDSRVHFRPRNFSTGTQEAVLSRYAGVAGFNTFDAATGQSISLGMVQLDHVVSWNTMSQAMTGFNKQTMQRLCGNHGIVYDDTPGSWTELAATLGIGNIAGTFYTLADARRYFNDVTNLQPSSGGANAQAGRAGVASDVIQDPMLSQMFAQTQAGFMSLQTQTGVQTFSEEQKERIADTLAQMQTLMAELDKEL